MVGTTRRAHDWWQGHRQHDLMLPTLALASSVAWPVTFCAILAKANMPACSGATAWLGQRRTCRGSLGCQIAKTYVEPRFMDLDKVCVPLFGLAVRFIPQAKTAAGTYQVSAEVADQK